jgi:hypothetical protein
MLNIIDGQPFFFFLLFFFLMAMMNNNWEPFGGQKNYREFKKIPILLQRF